MTGTQYDVTGPQHDVNQLPITIKSFETTATFRKNKKLICLKLLFLHKLLTVPSMLQ